MQDVRRETFLEKIAKTLMGTAAREALVREIKELGRIKALNRFNRGSEGNP